MKVPADHLHERIDPSVLKFFQERQAPFGCMNIVDVHIPTTGRVTELTCNALTVDYALSQICNVPDYGDATVAEHTFALLLAAVRHVPSATERTRRGDFSQSGLRGIELRDKVLGVIGTGRIGRRVIDELDVDMIVPGHGPIGTKADFSKMLDYLELVHTHARRAFDATASEEEAIRSIDLGEFSEWNESERITPNIARCYREFRNEIPL